MEVVNSLPKILEGIAALLWPVIVLLLVLNFRPALLGLLDSARSRKVTVKVAGNELSLDELHTQESAFVVGLQERLASLEARQKKEVVPRGKQTAEPATDTTAVKSINRILWVDDAPRKNSFLLDVLQRRGISVDTVLTTEDALALFSSSKYQLVISDMKRREDGRMVDDAGVRVTRKIRAVDPQVKIVVYCGARNAREMQDAAIAAGANIVTSNPAVLMSAIEKGPNEHSLRG